jgi:hypothetical protein
MGFAEYIIGAQIVLIILCIGLIIYLIIRRIKIRDKESFEKRDN